ncbi:MAG: F0F1 ATP synthase subunit B family protein [Agrobacterium sp.]|uniref:F0F1 ATP synthase subunit B family protein n=1 Tax=Agrobacterium sp. TaxID=361 RepID=UPI004037CD64
MLGHEGFGINTNIFETNIINLAAVLFIVVTFVGQNLTTLLENRKQTILTNLEIANTRALEAQEKLNNAKTQFDIAKKKAQEIREEGILRANSELKTVVSMHSLRLAKLEEFKNETVLFYQQKAFKEAYLYVVDRIMVRVRERLNRGLKQDAAYHVVINNFYVSNLTTF